MPYIVRLPRRQDKAKRLGQRNECGLRLVSVAPDGYKQTQHRVRFEIGVRQWGCIFSSTPMTACNGEVLMKKFIIAALAASTLATPALAAPYHGGDHRPQVEQRSDHRAARNDHRPMQHRGWNKGERFDYRQAPNYRVISSPRQYHLREAPRGYRWVQSGNDAVLIGLTTGIVASVLAGAIH